MKQIAFIFSLFFFFGCTPSTPFTQSEHHTKTCTMEYEPVCGEKKIQCITTPCESITQTYSNKCVAKNQDATILYSGECKEKETTTEALSEGRFEMNDSGNFSGELFVRGYSTLRPISEAFCTENCSFYRGVFFTLTEIGNKNFQTFLEQNAEGSYYATPPEDSLGELMLGCFQSDVITYQNHSDVYRTADKILDTKTTYKILNATPENPITLKLTKLPLSGGRGAPTCYSHFYDIEIK